MNLNKILLIVLLVFCVHNVNAQLEKSYTNEKGEKIKVKLGNVAFADKVVEFYSGKVLSDKKLVNPNAAIGIPDYKSKQRNKYVALGCAGEIVFKFIDNYLVDIEGYDIYLFEVGISAPKLVLISKDGKKWKLVGRLESGSNAIDIKQKAGLNEKFSYVKIKDLTNDNDCNNGKTGLNIDALVALGSLAVDDKLNNKNGFGGAAKEVILPSLRFWDGQQADGDIISISLNDVVVDDKLELFNKKRAFPTNLISGKNTLKISAVDEGQNPPILVGFEVVNGTQRDFIRVKLTEKNPERIINIFNHKSLSIRPVY